ncbi:hypothetical protein SAMN04489712_111112 [Thermomonospora echinospora]|uniref:Flagellar hook-length control protein FliK n=1 Tax=Thermomonospora echinospora TaxID=1992 RepID=A0A1H6CT33_9ACTN|nr:hypothetical protein [Thermomonospora echinospora]SEG76038.1 hypothetical protein SAMN04489712_111112 [Thermomonospora echinospora]
MRSGRAIAVVLAAAIAVLHTPPAQADPRRGTPGFCPDAGGVTVVIDFQELGGPSIVRCAPGPQDTGLAALQNAGISVTGTARWGLGFICRIEGKPGPSSEPCIDTPPASAYWSYWHAPNGGTWHYSDWGVKNRRPPPGSFEGWSFSKNRTAATNPQPRIAPVRPERPKDPDSPAPRSSGRPSPSTSASPPPSASPSASASSTPTVSDSAEPTPGPTDTPTQAPGWTGGAELPPAVPSAASEPMPVSTALGIGFLLSLLIAAVYATVVRARRDRR